MAYRADEHRETFMMHSRDEEDVWMLHNATDSPCWDLSALTSADFLELCSSPSAEIRFWAMMKLTAPVAASPDEAVL